MSQAHATGGRGQVVSYATTRQGQRASSCRMQVFSRVGCHGLRRKSHVSQRRGGRMQLDGTLGGTEHRR